MPKPLLPYNQIITDNITRRYQRYYTYIEPIVTDPIIRGYFSLAASLLLIAFLLVFALSPTINTIVTLRRKISDQQTIIKNLETKTRNLITAQENYNQAKVLIPALFIALPEDPTPQTIISGIISSASSSAVILGGLQFKNINLDKNLPGLVTVELSVSMQGSPSQVRSFLGKMENTIRYVRITNLGVNNPVDSQKISADIKGVGYFYSQSL